MCDMENVGETLTVYPTFSSYKGRIIFPGHWVEVYRNLNKPGITYSIRDKKSGLVLGHASNLLLTNCKFHVNQAGRERVRKTKKKQVHAWIEGSFSPLREWTDRYYNDGMLVKYNPYHNNHFVDKNNDAVRDAGIVYIRDQFVWAH